jgi:hydrogenase large subunit
LCRSIDARRLGEVGLTWLDRLIEIATAGPIVGVNDVPTPRSGRGMGVWDAPRGALGHWIEVEDGRVKNYQLVVPSTWNASPRDAQGVRGPYEESLIGVAVPDVNNPINVVRVIRSFDPCLACSVHLVRPDSKKVETIVEVASAR